MKIIKNYKTVTGRNLENLEKLVLIVNRKTEQSAVDVTCVSTEVLVLIVSQNATEISHHR